MTSEGKARSSANSLRHGLLARSVVLDDENGDTFADLLAAFERDLYPQNDVERSLVENMAIGRWRLPLRAPVCPLSRTDSQAERRAAARK